jgi:hypothetical protein
MSLQDNLDRAQYSISTRDVEGIKPKPYGAKQMTGADGVTGHISNSTLWLMNSRKNQLQTMMRLGATKGELKFVFDVYSDVVENAYNRKESTLKIRETIPSRTQYITNLINEGYEILGWVNIIEITSRKVPTY